MRRMEKLSTMNKKKKELKAVASREVKLSSPKEKKKETQQKEKKDDLFDLAKIVKQMRTALSSETQHTEEAAKSEEYIREQEKTILQTETVSLKKEVMENVQPSKFIKTYVPGLDSLLVEGIPRSAAVLICGGTGSGKTILNLQMMARACANGKKCLYLTLEESELRLIDHMMDFHWDARQYIKEGKLMFLRLNPFDIMRSVDALLAKEKGELLIDIKPVILPGDFKPDMIFVDSLTAIAAAFIGRKDTYRIYIEKLFRYFEEIGATTFLITETEQIPVKFSPTGTEEFLADGVIILYSIQRQNMRERAIEVLKMRGTAHQRKVVAMRIVKGFGIEIFPDQEVFVKIT